MSKLTPTILRIGRPEAETEPVRLQAGPLSMHFDPDLAFLRHIRIGDHEVLRGIYAAVRDQNWNTIIPAVSNYKVEALSEESFRLTFDVTCREGDIDFVWHGVVTGEANGQVTFAFDGECRSEFWNNRIGLCVLHPMHECAGRPATVQKTDGTEESGPFPDYIAPFQAFKNIGSITHEPAPGVSARVDFEGDSFEMEDQRNWTDASFKTYSGSVDAPMPIKAEKGARIRQTVTLSLPGEPKKILPVHLGRSPQLSISTTPVHSKPPTGLSVARHGKPLSDQAVERLKKLRLSHLRINLRLNDPNYPKSLAQATHQAQQLGATLHVGVILSDNAEEELNGLVSAVESVKAPVGLWLIFHTNEMVTEEKWVHLARQKLAALGKNILLAAGTVGNFVELNRNRPPADYGALPSYSIAPQIHAFDNTTMVENLATQPVTVDTLQQFYAQSAVISPITLRPHYLKDVAATSDDPIPEGELPPSVDERQMALFGAAWTVGSLKHLTTTGKIHSLTYYETTGWRGIMSTEEGSPLPDQFPSLPNAVFPVYHVFAAMADFDRIYPTHTSHPLQVEGLTLVNRQNQRRVIVANLENHVQPLKIKTGTCKATIRYLDETTAEEAMNHPERLWESASETLDSAAGKVGFELRPHGIAVVDLH